MVHFCQRQYAHVLADESMILNYNNIDFLYLILLVAILREIAH